MLCSTPYPESVDRAMDRAFELLKPGGFFVSLEEELVMFMSGAWKDPGVEEAQDAWFRAMAKGFMATKRSNTRIAPEMPTLFQNHGFIGLRTRPYCVPECVPPFNAGQVGRIWEYSRSLGPDHPDYTVTEALLGAGGMTSDEYERNARVLKAWWEERARIMEKGLKPVLNRQVYLLTVGRRPLE